MEATFEQVAKLAPDRIAFYSYAHLPSAFPAQKSFENYLPNQEEKRALYEFGKKILLNLGYVDIGMDHFAKPNDPLNQAKLAGRLHRNFMGFTTLPAKMLIGLGASSISDIHLGYAQNEKNISSYQESLTQDQWAITKGHLLTKVDLVVKNCILDLICKHETVVPISLWGKLPDQNRWNLKEMESDGLLKISGNRIKVTDLGIALVRNICMQLDFRLFENQEKVVQFSKAI
jgi:oxygen-independent coproporphyrinogen-3 oxidase